MFPADLRARIRDLLAAGRTVRDIAAECQVSFATVSRIATARPKRHESWLPDDLHPEPSRCGTCGSRVYISPCLACSLREEAERRRGREGRGAEG